MFSLGNIFLKQLQILSRMHVVAICSKLQQQLIAGDHQSASFLYSVHLDCHCEPARVNKPLTDMFGWPARL